ncbi:MAG: hypothetical protein IT480_07755 [Gammaproteobacteria bacterium]|nr:hypothetical protein [Gammaproteobacteria bacterium]
MPVRSPAPQSLPDPLPAISAAGAPAGTGTTTFVALSEDATLREAIGGAIAARGQVVLTATPHTFADELVARPDGIAILDLATVSGNAPLFIERLRAQFPALVLVAIGSARDQAALAPLVAEGSVCRFAHRPVSAQRLGLFLDAALRRRDALAQESRALLLMPRRPARPAGARIAALILLLIAAAGTGLWMLRRPAIPVAAPAAARVPAAAGTAVEPSPAAPPAPAAPAASAASAASADPAWPTALTQARHEAQLARERMEAGFLIDPPDDSARSHIDAAVRLAPDDVEVQRTARTLSGRLVNATRSALLARDAAAARHWLEAARAYGVNPTTLAELDEQLGMLEGMLGP